MERGHLRLYSGWWVWSISSNSAPSLSNQRNWQALMPQRRRTQSWQSTIAGTLSVHCPSLFQSGEGLIPIPVCGGMGM